MNLLIYGRRFQGKSTLALAVALSRNKQTVIFDTNSQYASVNQPVTTGEEVANRLERGDRLIRFQPDGGDVVSAFTDFADTVWEWDELVVLVDEAASVQSKASLHPGLERLIRQAPPSVDLIQTTHRLVDTQRLTRALATDVILFQSSLRADLDLIATEFHADVAEVVANLPRHHAVHYWLDLGGVERWATWDKPHEWHVRINDRMAA